MFDEQSPNAKLKKPPVKQFVAFTYFSSSYSKKPNNIRYRIRPQEKQSFCQKLIFACSPKSNIERQQYFNSFVLRHLRVVRNEYI